MGGEHGKLAMMAGGHDRVGLRWACPAVSGDEGCAHQQVLRHVFIVACVCVCLAVSEIPSFVWSSARLIRRTL